MGFDSHPLVKKRKLVIGGVEIPFPKGLDGWSDADVLTHAVMDALLGAAALGDIGGHFPPGEPQYKDISSLILLKEVGNKLAKEGWRIENIDATVIAEEPKLAGFIEPMRQNISQTLDTNIRQISVKASTAARLGSIGQGKGIEARAVALIESASNQAGKMISLMLNQIGLMTGSPEEPNCDCPSPQSDGAADSDVQQEGGKSDVTD
ncbi:2-C-methyl-D-erythritol 2,4-cyclodiphosphate synthase [Chloroflexota bacterium]